jgi:hypothetical protein
MNEIPISEQGRQASIPPVRPPAVGSIDEGVQSAPVAVCDDTRLKKIYVYADNVWLPQSANDTRTVIVKTDAFDLTGWVDFTHARPQDQFQTEIRVTMAHASGVLLQRAAFQGGGNLATMQQMAGLSSISGNHIEILIHQVYSLDNFATKVPIAYQFIVESR